ncbi:MAG TPA: protein kinase [Phycisphaerae bacterium]|nr:protein kinase [Phycisphaerales bacterium]HRX83469.1 protein kinase [Phycisphaerae bacterium]
MKNCPSDDELDRYRAHALDATAAQRVASHLTTCARCRQRNTARFLDALPHGEDTSATRIIDTNTGCASSASTVPASPGASPAAGRPHAGPGSDFHEGDPPGPPHIAGYHGFREIHRGGQGIVYQAVQRSTQRKVAIKLPLDDRDPAGVSRKRFEREIQLVAQLQHPNIVAVFDSGITRDNRRYFIMDYIRGLPLRDYVRRNQVPLEATLRLFCNLCRAVHHAHLRGVVHRDLKPSNVLVTADGIVKVLDFGLAKSLVAAIDTVVSTTGQFIGTLAYTAPEQLRGRLDEVDQRSDIYSLGVMLYELLTGRYPFVQPGELERLVEQFATAPPLPPSEAWTPAAGISREADSAARSPGNPIDTDLETIVLKTLAKESHRRYATAEDLAQDLELYLAGEPIAARRDSIAYVLKTRLRSVSQRHRVLSLAACFVTALLFTRLVGMPLAYRWTHFNEWYQRALTNALPAPADPHALADIRLIALSDQTDVKALARSEGLTDVDAGVPRSLRGLHGRLMEKLVDAHPRAVAYDITFVAASPYDEAFARGAQALRDAGTPVLVAVPRWWLDSASPVALSPAIARHTLFGCATGGCTADAPWRIQLFAKRGARDPYPSLALAAFAAFRQPAARAEFKLNADRDAIDVVYWQTMPASDLPQSLSATDHVAFSLLLPSDDGSGNHDPDYGLQPDDSLGLLLVDIPATAAFENITLKYGEVMNASPQALRKWFADRLILVADLRAGVDRHAHPDGRTLPGCYAKIASMASMLNTAPLRVGGNAADARPRRYAPLLLGLIVAGVVLGYRLGARRLARWAAALALAVLVVIGHVVLFASRGYLINPLPALVGLGCAVELAAAVRCFTRYRPIPASERSRLS